MKTDPPPVRIAHKPPCPTVPPLKGGWDMGQHGGFVPWDTRGTAWDSGTALTATAQISRLPRPPATRGKSSEVAELDSHHTSPTNHERIQTMTADKQTTRKPDTRTAAEATARPDLYAGTYWGNFRIEREAEITQEIIRNRNRFAEEWKIMARSHADIPRPTVLGGEDYDHPELYRDADRLFVLVVSNYGHDIPPPAVLGMKLIAPLYSTDATTYAGRYATLKELRARLEAVASGGGREKFSTIASLFREPLQPRRKRLRSRSKATT